MRAANPIFVTSPLTSIQTRHPRTHDTPTPLQFISPSFFFQHRAVYISDPPNTLFLKISLLLHCGVAGLILSWALLRATDIPVVSEWWEFATVADASEFVPVRYHPSSSTSLTATVIRGIDFVKPLKVVFHMHDVFPAFRRVCGFPPVTILRLQPSPLDALTAAISTAPSTSNLPLPSAWRTGSSNSEHIKSIRKEIGGVLQALRCSL